MLKPFLILLKHELLLEWHNRNAFGSVLLYLTAIILAVHFALPGKLPASSELPMLWIIILFTSFQTVASSSIRWNHARKLFFAQLAHPQMIILSRTFYVFGLISLLSLLTCLFFYLFFDAFVSHTLQLFAAVFSGSLGFAAVLTLISSIASHTRHSITLTAVLGLPLMIPLLILAISASSPDASWMNHLLLLLTDVLVLLLSVILFPYLWKD
jgi:heme exporter protein B